MPGKSVFKFVCGLLFFTLGWYADALESHAIQTGKTDIRSTVGILADQTGKRLINLTVKIADTKGVIINDRSITGENGFFRVSLPGEGSYLIVVEGYDPQLKSATTKPEDHDLHFGIIKLVPSTPPDSKASFSPRYTLTFTSAVPSPPGRLVWLPTAAAALAALFFQIVAITKYRSPAPVDRATMLMDLDNALKKLERDAISARSKWEKELQLALAEFQRKAGSIPAQPAGVKSETDSAQDPDGYARREGIAQIQKTAKYEPIVMSEAEQSGQGARRAGQMTLVDDYEQTRMSPECGAAIEAFQRRYSCVRLSLANEKDVVFIPGTKAEFEEDNRGWFLGVEENGQMLCFPWFSLDPAQQRQTFQAAFEYTGESSRVSSPARLSKLGVRWVLTADKGSIGGA